MSERVLFVDDERNLLDSFRRAFRKVFVFDLANNGREALAMMEDVDEPYAVIVCDQKMPGMSGAQVLAEVKERWPETVRVMLTGLTDMGTAMEAVNQGQIFRFLTKPSSTQEIKRTVEAAIEQYRLITAEKELLGKTLRGSVKVLTEVLSLTSPVAAGKTSRIGRYAKQLVQAMKLEDEWQYDLAAMLSLLGCITLPPGIVDKAFNGDALTPDEQELFNEHPVVAKKLIAHIPRLRAVAYMIANQLKDFRDFPEKQHEAPFVIGSQILRISSDLDSLVLIGHKKHEALHKLRSIKGIYHPRILEALDSLHVETSDLRMRSVTVAELNTRMMFHENVTAKNNIVLVKQGMEATSTVIAMLKSFSDGIGVHEPIRVMEYF